MTLADEVNAAYKLGFRGAPPNGTLILFPNGLKGIVKTIDINKFGATVIRLEVNGTSHERRIEVGVAISDAVVKVLTLPNECPPINEWPTMLLRKD